MNENNISVTGDLWLGKNNLDSVLNTLRKVLSSASDSVRMTAYSLTYSKEFFKILEDFLEKEIPLTLIINKFEKEEFDGVRNRIKKLIRNKEHFHVKNFNSQEGDLHAKIVVVDYQLETCKALIGSANLSWSAIARNHEILVKLEGDDADTAGDLFEIILHNTTDVNP